jgi:hypothetical protein
LLIVLFFISLVSQVVYLISQEKRNKSKDYGQECNDNQAQTSWYGGGGGIKSFRQNNTKQDTITRARLRISSTVPVFSGSGNYANIIYYLRNITTITKQAY